MARGEQFVRVTTRIPLRGALDSLNAGDGGA